jgi:hypothetical protein
MKNIFTFLLTFILSTNYVNAQFTEIGNEAIQIKNFIEANTRSRTGYDSYGNSKGNNVAFQVEYSNGQIKDVIQCFANQYLIDYGKHGNFCKHYIMENGKLAYTLTQYETITITNLKAHYNKLYSKNKIGELYYSDDYKHYSKVYLSKNNLATIEWRKTNLKNLPMNVQNKIKQEMALKIKKEEEKPVEETANIEDVIKERNEAANVIKSAYITDNYRLVIEKQSSNLFTLKVWNKTSLENSSPEIEVSGGEILPAGSGGNYKYIFKENSKTYEIFVNVMGAEDDPDAEYTVYENENEILNENAKK